MHDGPHSAILTGQNENLIEYNVIHNVCRETNDSGAIYTGRDWGSRGNTIRYNFLHHISTEQVGSFDVHAIYLDDCSSSHRVFGNVFYEVSGRAIMCGGGRDNLIENNVIVKCGAAHFTDRRGNAKINEIPGDSWNLLEKINRYDYTQPPWSIAYPALATIMDEGYDQAKEPKGNLIARNIGWQNGKWLEESSWGGSGGFGFYTIEFNIEDADPWFVDEASLNLELRPDSPAFGLPGFEAVPFDKMGRVVCPWGCDMDGDDDVDFADTARFAWRWGDGGCDSANGWCAGADLTGNSSVGGEDLASFMEHWLGSTETPAPGQASGANPADGAVDVNTSAVLSWAAGSGAESYDVYFGTTTGPGTYRGNQSGMLFDTGTMTWDTQYCWRVDSVNEWGKTIGKVQSFTTISPYVYTEIVSEGAAVYVHVPTDDSLGTGWTSRTFVPDSLWEYSLAGTGVGYERGSGYEGWINTDVESEMYGVGTSVFVIIEFNLNGDEGYEKLKLHMLYDDAFIAYLNGAEVYRTNNITNDVAGSATASGHEASGSFDEYDITAFVGELETGRNVLAIHGINTSAGSSDMLVLPKLLGGVFDDTLLP